MEWHRLSPGPRRMGTARRSRGFPREEKAACLRSGTHTQCPPRRSQVPAHVDPEESHQMMSLTPSRGTQEGSNSGGPGREAGPGLPPPQAE